MVLVVTPHLWGKEVRFTGVDQFVPVQVLVISISVSDSQCGLRQLVVHTCNSNTWEVEAEGPRIQDQIQLNSEFEASLDYIRAYFDRETDRQSELSAQESLAAACRIAMAWPTLFSYRLPLMKIQCHRHHNHH